MRSANVTQAVTLGQTLFATAPIVNGAVAYAWFVGPAGSETLQAITPINSATFSAPLTAGQQLANTVAADNSRNATLAFDDLLLTVGFNHCQRRLCAGAGAGSAGTTARSFDRVGPKSSVVEIDQYAGADVEHLSDLADGDLRQRAQEQKNITNKCLTNASGPLLHYNVAADGDNSLKPYGVSAFQAWCAGIAYNPFSVDWRNGHPAEGSPRSAAGHDPRLLRASAGVVPVEPGSQRRRGSDAPRLFIASIGRSSPAPASSASTPKKTPRRLRSVRRRHP